MIVTTSVKGQGKLEEQARHIALELKLPYYARRKESIADLFKRTQASSILLLTTEGLKCYAHADHQAPFFFHPGSAMFRVKRLMRGERDPLVDATGLKAGMSYLDATLGLGSDALIASFVCGENGRVVGIESNPILAYIAQQGMKNYHAKLPALGAAMRRVVVRNDHHLHYLQACPSKSVDVIYFDPMFDSTIKESAGLTPLKAFAHYDRISMHTIKEAKRVAKQRIVLKGSAYSTPFNELGFTPLIRKHASHWYGVIDLQ